ncbi:MAE_28990/MAE_18760 family HEPN-like nuclease [Streptomyces synnematoformans]|uniref:MAE_28990/MAE_18760 family HEPN-like nuclease n=1 Tax=Streptomyces synnematoformans TaxID=415721 RepID=UPI003CD0B981
MTKLSNLAWVPENQQTLGSPTCTKSERGSFLETGLRTVNELQDWLDQDLAWRRSELHSFLSSVRRTRSDSVAQRAFCRAGIPLLYAHWEGYTKSSLSAYLKFVGRRKLTYAELDAGFITLAVEAAIDSMHGASSTQRSIQRVKTLLADNTRASIPWRRGVDTRANLNSGHCFDLFELLGLNSEPLHLKSHLIDYELLRVRNEVAHGEYLNVDPIAYEELHSTVIDILNFIRNTISAAAENGSYRRNKQKL